MKIEGNIKRERFILTKLQNHPGIIKLHFSFTDAQNLYFAMDYAKNGNLRELLLKICIFLTITY